VKKMDKGGKVVWVHTHDDEHHAEVDTHDEPSTRQAMMEQQRKNTTLSDGALFCNDCRLAMARHIDTTSVGAIDIVVAQPGPSMESSDHCSLHGWSSTNASAERWDFAVPFHVCRSQDLDGFAKHRLALSDDGSTFIFAYMTGSEFTTPMIIALDAQSGTLLWEYTAGAGADSTDYMLHVDLSRDGAHILFVTGSTFVVLEKSTGKPRAGEHDMGAAVEAQICPMGVFITYGSTTATVLKWNSTKADYTLQHTFQPPAKGWVVASSTTSVNGGGGNASTGGCVCAFSWTRSVVAGTSEPG
jgi:hypothetical protein